MRTIANAQGVKHCRLAVYLDEEALRQLNELSTALHVASRSAVIAQAIAKWHNKEPLVKALIARKESAG